MKSLRLLLGIKRLPFRENDPRRAKADTEFAAKKPAVLVRHRHTCMGCTYESKLTAHLDVHHRDDNHHNNADDNLVPACHTCHPYQHVGEIAKRADVPGEGLGRKTLVACIPEIKPSDLNLLQRAIGVALLDEAEAPIARKMIEILASRAEWVKAEFGSFRSADFAAAMAALNNEQYEAREDAVADLRLLFNEDTLKRLGKEMLTDYPSLPMDAWPDVAERVAAKVRR